MTAWVLIGFLGFANVGSGGGGPFTAEFANEAACRSALEQVKAVSGNLNDRRFLICVPKGGANAG